MPRIQLLDELTANQIAAGEVVERPAAAAKELIENAIDAGATRIVVEAEEGGRTLLRVTDNGSGMPPDDASLALQRHATSKISSADDLTRLRTLGFRGEALPSIASVSHFELVTRPPDDEAATRIVLEGGRVVERGEAGAPPGTRITVRHLFFNTPARLKFIKSTTTEMNHIVEIAGRLAMAHAHVAMRLVHNAREVFSTPGTGDPLDALAALWGRERAAALLAAESETSAAAVTGFVSPPEHSRPNRMQQVFFVNGRPIASRLLAHALDHTFRPLIPDGRFAAGALFLEIPPEDVDVNVHPSKTEVRFRVDREIHSAVSRAVRAALLRVPSITKEGLGYEPPPIALLRPGDRDRPLDLSPERFLPDGLLDRAGPAAPVWAGVEPPAAPGLPPSPADADRGYDAPVPAAEQEWDPFGPVDPILAGRSGAATSDDRHDSTPPPAGAAYTGFAPVAGPRSEAPLTSAADLLSGMRLLGQVMNTFLVGEGRDGIVLIDQHVAHERILYDRLLRAHQGREQLPIQRLLLPLTITLSGREAAALDLRLAELARLGFEIEPFGGDTFLLRALPLELGHRDPEAILRDLAADLIDDGGPNRTVMERAVDAVIASASCHGAIKAHMALGPAEMRRLIEDLIRCDNPFHCPHGRPILVRITSAELFKWFKRTG